MSRSQTLDTLVSSPSSSIPTPSAARLQSLYTFTSNQALANLTGYQANLQWWTRILRIVIGEGWLDGDVDGVGGGSRLCLRVDEGLLSRLEWSGVGKPKGMGGVIASLTHDQPPVLMSQQTFMSSPTSIHATPSLMSRYITSPLLNTLSSFNPFSSNSAPIQSSISSSSSLQHPGSVESETSAWKRLSSSGRGQTFVHIPLLSRAADQIMSFWETNPAVNYSDTVFGVEGFRVFASEILLGKAGGKGKGKGKEGLLSLGDCKVLLKYLTRDKGALITDSAGEIYKLAQPKTRGETISEADRGTVMVTTTILNLERQVDAVEREIEIAKSKTAHHLQLKQQPLALSYLRSKKQLEGVLEKRLGALDQLRTVLRGIDGAKGDIEIMAAYDSSTSTLKSILSHPSLQREEVDSTLDSLAAALSDQQDLDTAIKIGGEVAVDAAGVSVDEDELERELQDLIGEGKSEGKSEVQAGTEDKEKDQEKQRNKALEMELAGLTAGSGDLSSDDRRKIQDLVAATAT